VAKFVDAINALAVNEATKALAESLRVGLGVLVDLDVGELASRVAAGGDRAARDLQAALARVSEYEARDREAVLVEHFAAAAKTHGVRADAVATARALFDAKSVQVDLEKRTVTGLTKDVFESLKARHGVLFEVAPAATAATVTPAAPAVAAAVPAASIPALPPASGGGAVAAQPELPGAIGSFVKASKL
jgi:hypothetical protein